MAALEAPAWRNNLRLLLKVCRRTNMGRSVISLFKNGIAYVSFTCLSPGRLTQTNTAGILGAAVGGAAMLFIVVVVLFLRRRSVLDPLCCPPCLSVLLIRQNVPSYTCFLSFFCPSFVGPQNGLCIHTFLTSLFLSSFSQLSLFLSLDLCPSTHWGRIYIECALSLLNGYVLVSVGAFERKLVQGGTLLVIRGAWFFLYQTTGTL